MTRRRPEVEAQYWTPLERCDLWTTDQYVPSTDLPGTEREEFAEPAQVPNVRHLRKQDRVWRPSDYRQLPTTSCHGPGYTVVHDVDLVTPGMALAPDGRFIMDDRTRLTPPTLQPVFARDVMLGRKRRSRWARADVEIDKGILLSGAGSNVYGHHLLDYLPGLAMLDDFGVFGDWPVLMPRDFPKWIADMMQEFTGRRREITSFPHRRRQRIFVRRLCVPWVVRSPAFHPVANQVFSRVVEAMDGRNREGQRDHSRIYVTRNDGNSEADKRPLTNADEIRAMFHARGFELVEPEHLPFIEQVRMFASASVVAGEAGSGLHGTVFSRSGSVTVELRPVRYRLLAQPAIAVLKEHVFASVRGTNDPGPAMKRKSWGAWSLAPDTVEQVLEDLGLSSAREST